jgi:hypothetical protein
MLFSTKASKSWNEKKEKRLLPIE